MKKYSILFVLVATLLFSCGKDAEKPTVVTDQVVDITSTSAKVNAKVENDGGAEVTARGVCWATTQNPTVEDNKTTDDTDTENFISELGGLEPQTTYYVRAYAINEVGTGYGEEISFTTSEKELVGVINGFEYFDLGLPSGLKWASHNVGATSMYEMGDYFAWGETKSKDSFDAGNCFTYGVPIGDFSGNEEYDVATAAWGSTWRMPTETEMRELKDNCTWEWIMLDNGAWGGMATGPNGNQIFFPAGGFKTGVTVDFIEAEAAYWTSTPDNNEHDLGFGTFFYLYNNNTCNIGWMSRYVGLLVRPVSE